MKKIVVLCDNLMGMPGGEIDDGLAILYMLGNSEVRIEAILCTHGNGTTEQTFSATNRLVHALGIDAPVVRGVDDGSCEPGQAARLIAEAAAGDTMLLSLGAATELAGAEHIAPGCLSRYSAVSLMGGITHTLTVGGKIMDELNFSVDGFGACCALGTGAQGARILLADAHNCLPLTFDAAEFAQRVVDPGYAHSAFISETCIPWMEHARTTWNVHGFVGWDVLAALALVQPELVELRPFEVSLNPRLFTVGLIEQSRGNCPVAPIHLITIPNPDATREAVYAAWQTAAQGA